MANLLLVILLAGVIVGIVHSAAVSAGLLRDRKGLYVLLFGAAMIWLLIQASK